MNTCCLVGRLTRAPTVKFEGDGQPTVTFTLAVPTLSRAGTPFPTYVRCTSWGRPAEACAALGAEDLVAISGRITWEKQRCTCGTERSVHVVFVRYVEVLKPAAVEVPTPAVPALTGSPQ